MQHAPTHDFVSLHLTQAQATELLAIATNGYGDGSFYNLDTKPTDEECQNSEHATAAMAALGQAMAARSATTVKDSVHMPPVDKLAKLPMWAQQAFKNLERERFVAVRELKAWTDSQTPGPIFIEEYISTGEGKSPAFVTRYVEGKKVSFVWQGVELEVILTEGDSMSENAIALKWNQSHGGSMGHVALIPTGFHSAILMHPKHMRYRPELEGNNEGKAGKLKTALEAAKSELERRRTGDDINRPLCTCKRPCDPDYMTSPGCPVHDPKGDEPPLNLDDVERMAGETPMRTFFATPSLLKTAHVATPVVTDQPQGSNAEEAAALKASTREMPAWSAPHDESDTEAKP